MTRLPTKKTIPIVAWTLIFRCGNVRHVHRLWAITCSGQLVRLSWCAAIDLGLLDAELFLHRNIDGIIQCLGIHTEQLLLDWKIIQGHYERYILR
ncbi:hypothetical protein Plhal304r1_c062g0149631 [Plasmopara halstedii]